MQAQTTPAQGKPRKINPIHAATAAQNRAQYLANRREKAANTVANFDKLPDSARIKQPVVELLLSVSYATVWRKVKDGTFPKPRKDGAATSWSVGQIRAIMNGEVTA
jgi:predicted DNA-binding transcriptional regulator AlpA